MGKVIAYQGNTFQNSKDMAIGVFQFPDRKRPSLGIREGNVITVYGTFKNERNADLFMDRLAEFMNVPKTTEKI